MLLEPIYEQDFRDCSFGFRSGRNAHQALRVIRHGIVGQGARWVLEVDVRKYFDSIDHAKLRELPARRVTDGVVRRMIDKWLKAGVLEQGQVSFPGVGTPQGGVISPLLSNVFLHCVLDGNRQTTSGFSRKAYEACHHGIGRSRTGDRRRGRRSGISH